MASQRQTRDFYSDIARWAADRGWLRMIFLRLDGRAIAAELCLEQGGRLFDLKGGYRLEYRKHGPGKIIALETIEWAHAQGLSEFDFVGSDDPYKLQWTDLVRERSVLRAFAPSPAGATAWAAWAVARPLALRAAAAARKPGIRRPGTTGAMAARELLSSPVPPPACSVQGCRVGAPKGIQGVMTSREKLMFLAATLFALVTMPASAHASSTVWAVGDGAAAGSTDDQVGAMIAQDPFDAFLYLGDVYDSGTSAEFAYYNDAYGSYKSKSFPTPGNHEWGNRATGYDPYWGAGFSAPHYYSFDVGGWHLISLNSEEASGAGSAQLSWLQADLASHPGTCTLAYWHRPRYTATSRVDSTFSIGDDSRTNAMWQALAGRASIALAGHAHNYQRLNPIDGITELIVGTGGEGNEHHTFTGPDSRLAASNDADFGALKLVLEAGRADFSMRKLGGGVLDSGSIACKAKPQASTGSASGVSRNAANVAGTVDPNGEATSYRFNYGTTDQYGSQSPSVAAGSGSEPQTVSASLANLSPDTTYHYSLVATNSLGTSSGPDKTFTTPPAPITTITSGPSGAITTRSAEFRFSSEAAPASNVASTARPFAPATRRSPTPASPTEATPSAHGRWTPPATREPLRSADSPSARPHRPRPSPPGRAERSQPAQPSSASAPRPAPASNVASTARPFAPATRRSPTPRSPRALTPSACGR